MKAYQLQTPKKDHQHANSRSKSICEHNKKPQKISKICLDSAFGMVLEDVSLESTKDSMEFSSVSEIKEDESAEGWHCKSVESHNSAGIVSVETEMVINHLKQARIQVTNSTNVDVHLRKLVDNLIDVVIEELSGLPDEKDRVTKLVSMKFRAVSSSFLLWILAALVFVFCSGG